MMDFIAQPPRNARESFLSFARGAFETKTRFDYPDKTTPVARQNAVYTCLSAGPDGLDASAVRVLLSWCIVALEEHLSEGGPSASKPREGEVLNIANHLHNLLYGFGGERDANVYRDYGARQGLAAAVIKALDEYRTKHHAL